MRQATALFLLMGMLWMAPTTGSVHASPRAMAVSLMTGRVGLSVDKPGIYRVSGSWLESRGITWSGISAGNIAITHLGKPVARLVSTNQALSSGSYVEFYAGPFFTQYTTTSVYYLSADKVDALPITRLDSSPSAGAQVKSYSTQFVEDRLTYYDPIPPTVNWFYTTLVANAGPAHVDDHVVLSDVSRNGRASIWFRVWGATNLGGPDPQHIVLVKVNGRLVGRLRFSGNVFKTKQASFPASWLKSGENTIRFASPGTVKNQYNLDEIDIAPFTLTYQRKVIASAGTMTASLPGGRHVTATGFGSRPTVWMVGNGTPRLIEGVALTKRSGAYTASFSTRMSGSYVMTGQKHLLRPAGARRQPSTSYLLSGHARFLVISPRRFWKALKPLVAYHDARGTPTKLADLADVFARYSLGSTDPMAIHDYIHEAVAKLGIVNVLLVGADTFDYHHYSDCSQGNCPGNPRDVSYLPSLYTRDDFYGQIPSDELYVDGGGKGPTAGIGRIPALNAGQVKTVVTKTIAWLKRTNSVPSAVMAAGAEDPAFQFTSETLRGLLPARYAVTTAYEAVIGSSPARKALLARINGGTTIVNFVGHGNLEQWGNEPPLLSVDDVPRLKNKARTEFFFGWGCQTAYDVDPTDRALNARLLMDTRSGAILSLGSTGLDLAAPQAALAEGFYTQLFHGVGATTVGEALKAAEVGALKSDPSAIQPVQSYEIFGDPAIPLSGLR